LKKETFVVVLLNSANRIVGEKAISEGSLNASIVHPREVFKVAIDRLAASIVLAHNHPSGNTQPSKEDMAITEQLVEAGKLIGIPVHDHLIVAGDRYTSFAEENPIRY
jgi:DNA repair protein RadC